MPALLLLRPLSDDERGELRRLTHGQKVDARLREQARICWRSHDGESVGEIMAVVHLDERTVRRWIHRFNARGLPRLTDTPRQGRPTTYIGSGLVEAVTNVVVVEAADRHQASFLPACLEDEAILA